MGNCTPLPIGYSGVAFLVFQVAQYLVQPSSRVQFIKGPCLWYIFDVHGLVFEVCRLPTDCEVNIMKPVRHSTVASSSKITLTRGHHRMQMFCFQPVSKADKDTCLVPTLNGLRHVEKTIFIVITTISSSLYCTILYYEINMINKTFLNTLIHHSI